MDGTKTWLESKTIWSDLLTVATGLAVSFHGLTAEQAKIIVSDGPTLAVGIVTIVLGIVGMYGRIVATKKVVL